MREKEEKRGNEQRMKANHHWCFRQIIISRGVPWIASKTTRAGRETGEEEKGKGEEKKKKKGGEEKRRYPKMTDS